MHDTSRKNDLRKVDLIGALKLRYVNNNRNQVPSPLLDKKKSFSNNSSKVAKGDGGLCS